MLFKKSTSLAPKWARTGTVTGAKFFELEPTHTGRPPLATRMYSTQRRPCRGPATHCQAEAGGINELDSEHNLPSQEPTHPQAANGRLRVCYCQKSPRHKRQLGGSCRPAAATSDCLMLLPVRTVAPTVTLALPPASSKPNAPPSEERRGGDAGGHQSPLAGTASTTPLD